MGLVPGNLRLLISVPPRNGKSELVSHWTPVWYLSLLPTKKFIVVSYEATFAASWGRKARDSMLAASADLGVKVREDMQAADNWELAEGGGMVTAGIGGPITGRGGDIIVVDDPIKNWEEANSLTVKEAQRNWWVTTLRNRLEPGASIVVIMARWTPDDLIGWLLRESGETWEYIAMPAIAEGQDVLGRQPGELLWPERWPADAVLKTRQGVGEDAWKSQFQQRPEQVAGDCYFDVEVLNRLAQEALPGDVFKPYILGHRYAAFIDSRGEGRDNQALSVMDAQTGVFVVHLENHWPRDEFTERAYKILEDFRFPLLGIEANGVGLAMIDKIMALGYPKDKVIYQDEKRQKPGVAMGSNLRGRILSNLQGAIRVGECLVLSKVAINEMYNFIRQPNGGPEARPGGFDDGIIAMAGANWAGEQVVITSTIVEPHLVRYGSA